MYQKETSLADNNEAVSEIIGEILLTGIAVIAFSIISVFLLSPQGFVEKPSLDVDSWIKTDTNTIFFRHAGGEKVETDNIRIFVNINNDRYHINPPKLLTIYNKTSWELGDTISLDTLALWGKDIEDTDQIYVVMVHLPSNKIMKSGMILGNPMGQSNVNHTKPLLQKSLVSMWNCDENSGSILHDITGDNDGTIYGATWGTGIKNNSLVFNGKNNYVAIPHSPSLDFTDEISILFWMNCRSVTSTNTIIGKGSYEKNNFYVFVSQRELIFEWNDSNSYIRTSKMSLSNNLWYMIGITFDNNEVRFYKNGRFIESEQTNGVKLRPNTNDLWIGRQNSSTSDFYYRGRLDEVALYNKALSGKEIMEYYNATVQG
ncbi:MAG: type IV pilin [Methanomethylovorans sp.]|nr:type IV pilin [Methanomethylovorans sp.]